jgi:hypothetical protein
VVGDFFDWVVGIWSSAVDGSGLPPQVMDFASIPYAIFVDLQRLRGFLSWYGQEVLTFALFSCWCVV